MSQWKQEFSKKFLSLIKHKNRYELFRDWAHLSAITCEQMPVNLGILPRDESYEQREKCYLERVKAFDSNTLEVFSEMLGALQLGLNESLTDFLGELHQELEISFQRDNGQFFTPFSIAKVTAEATITADFLQDIIKKNGFITVAEPAVGAGSLLIAGALVMKELGYDPCRQMYFEGVDIDPLCCDLSYIQMSIIGVPGVIIHGNSLSMETWSRRATPKLQLIRRYREISPMYKISQVLIQMEQEDLNDSAVTLKAEKENKGNPKQLNLFEDL
jgi:N-6 DNA Methylase